MTHWTVDLEDLLYPGTTLYPDATLYPGTVFLGISDSDVNAITLHKNESVTITDEDVNGFGKYLEEGGLYPYNTLYPNGLLYPNSGILVTDICVKNSGKIISDGVSIGDVISRFMDKGLYDNLNAFDSIEKGFIKYLVESGLTPDNILYPYNTLYPDGGLCVDDNHIFDFGKNVGSALSVIDNIGKYILKDLPDDINISDNILFGIYLHLSENPNILDEISKASHKTLDESFTITDIITKNVIAGLSETVVITDVMTYDMRKLVRATLEAFKGNYASLEALKNKYAVLTTE